MDSETINGTFLRKGELAWYRKSYDVMVPVKIEKIPDDSDTIRVKVTATRSGTGMRKGQVVWVAGNQVHARDAATVTRVRVNVFGRTILVPDSIANKAIPVYRVEVAYGRNRYELRFDDIDYERALAFYNNIIVGNGGKKRLTKNGVVKRRKITQRGVYA